ncbi:hypothetical protein BDB00DRAFT_826192 [Zychaea mexicana]|uniref:uncharacterized protein n=1 Tax=Zychaea mexicana TaxID=64656 RepID=UPI0022FECFF7|nr:uncharacterized protein BDB00DRAFT_826192 [Zychaea mexicana]KAI9492930.1 hypothetical protein BDB00DRAFT_826192 [Zychaea mexicana]
MNMNNRRVQILLKEHNQWTIKTNNKNAILQSDLNKQFAQPAGYTKSMKKARRNRRSM